MRKQRGPVALWRRFDQALDQLNRAVGATDLEHVTDAFAALGDISGEPAIAVAKEDHAGAATTRAEQRRSA